MLKTAGPGFRKFKKRFRRSFISGLAKIDTDLNFRGIMKGFAVCKDTPRCPTGDCVVKGSHERPDAYVLLQDGRELHITPGKDNNLKLILEKDGVTTSPEIPHLWWVDIETMKDAIACGALQIGGQILKFANTRPLKRMLARASLAGAP